MQCHGYRRLSSRWSGKGYATDHLATTRPCFTSAASSWWGTTPRRRSESGEANTRSSRQPLEFRHQQDFDPTTSGGLQPPQFFCSFLKFDRLRALALCFATYPLYLSLHRGYVFLRAGTMLVMRGQRAVARSVPSRASNRLKTSKHYRRSPSSDSQHDQQVRSLISNPRIPASSPRAQPVRPKSPNPYSQTTLRCVLARQVVAWATVQPAPFQVRSRRSGFSQRCHYAIRMDALPMNRPAAPNGIVRTRWPSHRSVCH